MFDPEPESEVELDEARMAAQADHEDRSLDDFDYTTADLKERHPDRYGSRGALSHPTNSNEADQQ